MKILLSTAAMVLTLACSGMAYAHDDEHGDGDRKGPPPFMEDALSKLPEKDAEQFRDTMKQAHEKDHALHEQMHKLHDELHAIMTAEKFDKKAFIAKSKELGKLEGKMRASMTEAFAAALAPLSQDERKTLADAMRDGMHHGPHGPHDHHESDKPDSDKPAPESDSDK